MEIGQYVTETMPTATRADGAVDRREDGDDRRPCRCRHDKSRDSEGAKAWRDDEANPRRAGRRHVRRSLMHLARDIRHQVRDEIRDLRVSGEADSEKIAAVKEAYRDFRSSLKDVFHDAGRGRDFDPASISDGVAEAMGSFTEALQEINGTAPEEGTPVVPVPEGEEEVPTVPQDIGTTTRSITIQIGIVIDFAA